MAGNLYQLHILETPQPLAGLGDQNLQPGYLRTIRSAHITNGDIAVAAHYQ